MMRKIANETIAAHIHLLYYGLCYVTQIHPLVQHLD